MSMTMAVADRRRSGRLRTAVAMLAITMVWAGLRVVGFRRSQRTAGWVARRARRAATIGQVRTVLDAVDAGAAWLPLRVACLERSLAAVLLLAVHRRGITWCVGVRTPPLAMHAWLSDAEGRPIGEAAATASYQPVVIIGPPRAASRSST